MNKVIRFSVFAAACVAFALLPASLAHADEILPDDLLFNDEILDEYDGINDTTGGDDILSPVDGGSYDDILIEDGTSDSGYGEDEILIEDPISDQDTSRNGRKRGGGSGDLLMPEPPSYEVPVTTPAPAPNPGNGNNGGNTNGISADMNKVLSDLNARRTRAGVRTLSFSDELNKVAAVRVKETTQKFSHIRPNGKSAASILTQYGVNYGRCGENIACYVTADELIAAWSSSPTHNSCMMNGNYAHVGIGTTTVGNCQYWVLILTD